MREKLRGHSLFAGIFTSMFICMGLGNAGFRSAAAFESQVDVKAKSEQSRDTISFKGHFRDPGWLSIKADGSVLDLNPMRADALAWYGFKLTEPAPLEKQTVTDSRISLGVWDDRVRWSSRQAVSNYFKPGTDLEYLRRAGVGFDSGATSQRLEATVFRTDSIRVSLLAEYARVGTHFAAPDGVIKRQDPFFKRNSTTSQFGATIEGGGIVVSLEQLAQQSLDQSNASILLQNRVGLSLSFDQLLGRNGGARQGISWLLPSSGWVSIGQGIVRAPVSQGIAGDTASDVSFGFAWNVGKFYANAGYWRSEYQSLFYPWKGSGLNGSLGFHDGAWAVDLYFDVSSSLQSYEPNVLPQPITRVMSGVSYRARF